MGGGCAYEVWSCARRARLSGTDETTRPPNVYTCIGIIIKITQSYKYSPELGVVMNAAQNSCNSARPPFAIEHITHALHYITLQYIA